MRRLGIAKIVLVVFFLTYSLVGSYYFLFGSPELGNDRDPFANQTVCIPFTILGLILMWIPGIVSLFFAKKEGIKLRIFQKPDWMYLNAALCAIGLSFAAVALSIPFNQWNEIPTKTVLNFIVSSLVLSLTLMPLICLGEELFWRGYLHEKLKYLGLIKTSLIIGAIWGIWHAPMMLMGIHSYGHPVIGVVSMCLLCIATSPIFFWFREQGKSILIPSVLHATINSFSGLSFIVFSNCNPLLSGVGLGGLVTMLGFSLFLMLRDRRKCNMMVSSVKIRDN